jgi:hypothetical protein
MDNPDDILFNVLKRASEHVTQSSLEILIFASECMPTNENRACARLLMAWMVAAIARPDIDPVYRDR